MKRVSFLNDGFNLCHAGRREEAVRLFNGLSKAAIFEMPMADSPWCSYFGMFRDRHGIEWIMEFDSGTNR